MMDNAVFCFRMKPVFRMLPVVLATLILAGCATLPRTPFTKGQEDAASVGITNARAWGDENPRSAMARARQVAARTRGENVTILALSGGGADGSFSAGALVGLSETGRRPVFDVVTGVSAGALIAPFAFLGEAYDPVLIKFSTEGSLERLSSPNNPFEILRSGLLRREPLQELVASLVDPELLSRVAQEHDRGRKLYVLTTNLDAQRPVIWDMGAIAASGAPRALRLFRDVLVASASIPGAFSPVLIDVNASGHNFSEMHVDGSVTSNVYIAPESVLLSKAGALGRLKGRFYILVNSKIEPDFEVVENSTFSVARRSLATVLKSNLTHVLSLTYQFARRNNFDFNLAYIMDDFPTSSGIDFSVSNTRRVFGYGRERARSGALWTHTLPIISRERSAMTLQPK